MLSHGCRVPRQVSGTGSVSAELGRRFRHLHHAGDWTAAAASPGGLRPALQNAGKGGFFQHLLLNDDH